MMNLMVVLIPLLLSTASAIRIGIIELNLPQATSGGVTEATGPKEVKRGLDLTVSITTDGFYLSSSQAVLGGEEAEGPTIPLTADGSYNYERLNDMLTELKRKIQGKPVDTKRIIIQAEPQIEYQILVSTMDAARRSYDQEFELFPDVTISAGII
jgi:biopolymer transport protein ExbD